MTLFQPSSAEHWAQARSLIQSYAESLGFDLGFQNFADELASLESMYGPPDGAFWLAESEGSILGCVALRKIGPGDGEMKRLYVLPSGRGLGVGRALTEALIVEAKRLGYGRILLDTVPGMEAAQQLYVSLGFKRTQPYRHNPVPGTAFMELRLT